jgi:hypothetical protein
MIKKYLALTPLRASCSDALCKQVTSDQHNLFQHIYSKKFPATTTKVKQIKIRLGSEQLLCFLYVTVMQEALSQDSFPHCESCLGPSEVFASLFDFITLGSGRSHNKEVYLEKLQAESQIEGKTTE